MTTRTGKIARLPRDIREQLNQRLHDGEPAVRLVEWLNYLPEVRTALADQFHNQPITEQNLSHWKQGGYEDWLGQQELLTSVQHTLDEADQLKETVPGSLAEPMAQLLVARLSVALRQLRLHGEDGGFNWAALHALSADLVELRRGDQNAERMRIERERLQMEHERLEMDRQHDRQRTVEQFLEWSQRDDIKEKICGRIDNRQIIEQLGRIMFGPNWRDEKPAVKPPPSPAESNQIQVNQTTPPPAASLEGLT